MAELSVWFPPTEHPAWHSDAACLLLPPEMFFREDGESRGVWGERNQLAKAVCHGCPVRAECTAQADVDREPEGIWGGYEYPAHWRTPVRRAARAVARAAARAGAEAIPLPRLRVALPAA